MLVFCECFSSETEADMQIYYINIDFCKLSEGFEACLSSWA